MGGCYCEQCFHKDREIERLQKQLTTSTPPLIYLACPYTDPCPTVRAGRYILAMEVVDALLARGVLVLSGRVYVQNLARDRKYKPLFHRLIERCDELWVLMTVGWEASIGVLDEIVHAQACGKPVKYLDPVTLAVRDEV